MKAISTSSRASAGASKINAPVEEARAEVKEVFEKFCLATAIACLTRMMDEDADRLAGKRYGHSSDKPGYRWGHTRSQVCFHGGKIDVERPRLRSKTAGKEMSLPSWEKISADGCLGRQSVKLMTESVASRKLRPAAGCGLPKSPGSRRFKALTQAKFDEWMASDLSETALVAVHIDGLRVSERLMMIGAAGVDASGRKRPLGVIEGATENAAAVQALLDDLIRRGLDPEGCYLFVVDRAGALSEAVRRTFGEDIPVQRCQVYKARNITDRLAVTHHADVRRTFKQAWELDDADEAERLMRGLAQRFEQEAPDVSRSILEGLDEILTVARLGLPFELRQSLASKNIIESMNGAVRQVCRSVKRWKNAGMALRWTAAGMMEAEKGFRRIKACRQLPVLKQALIEHRR